MTIATEPSQAAQLETTSAQDVARSDATPPPAALRVSPPQLAAWARRASSELASALLVLAVAGAGADLHWRSLGGPSHTFFFRSAMVSGLACWCLIRFTRACSKKFLRGLVGEPAGPRLFLTLSAAFGSLAAAPRPLEAYGYALLALALLTVVHLRRREAAAVVALAFAALTLPWFRLCIAQLSLKASYGEEVVAASHWLGLTQAITLSNYKSFALTTHGMAWLVECFFVFTASLLPALDLARSGRKLRCYIGAEWRGLRLLGRATVIAVLGLVATLLGSLSFQSARTVVLPFEVSDEAKALGYSPDSVASAIAAELEHLQAGSGYDPRSLTDLQSAPGFWNHVGVVDRPSASDTGNLGLSVGAVSVSGSIPWFQSLFGVRPNQVKGSVDVRNGTLSISAVVNGKSVPDSVPLTGHPGDMAPLLARVAHLALPHLIKRESAGDLSFQLADARLWESAREARAMAGAIRRDDARLSGMLPEEQRLQHGVVLGQLGLYTAALGIYSANGASAQLQRNPEYVEQYLSSLFLTQGVAALRRGWQDLKLSGREAERGKVLTLRLLAVTGQDDVTSSLLKELEPRAEHDYWAMWGFAIAHAARDDTEVATKAILSGIDRAFECRDQPSCRASVWENWGSVLLSLERPSAAEAAFNRALSASPEYPAALAGHAQALIAQERYAEAIDDLRRAQGRGRDTPGLLTLLCTAQQLTYDPRAEEVCRDAALADPLDPLGWTELGWLALSDHDDVARAREHVRRAEWIRPDTIDAIRLRARILTREAAHEQALAVLDSALTRRPTAIELWVERSGVLLEQHQYVEALSSLEKGREQNPKRAVDTWRAEGDVRLAQGEFVEAAASYSKATPPNRVDASAMVGRAESLAAQQQWNEARSLLTAALKLNPFLPDAHALLAQIGLDEAEIEPNVGLTAPAIRAHARAALSIDPRSIRAWHQLARVEAKSDPLTALDVLDQAAESTKTTKATFSLDLARAEALEALKRDDAALALLTKTSDRFPHKARIALALGDHWRRRGRAARALAYYQQTQQLDRGGRLAKCAIEREQTLRARPGLTSNQTGACSGSVFSSLRRENQLRVME